MQLEEFFDFNTEPAEHIRLKGTRIDIAHVIERYRRGESAAAIADAAFAYPLDVAVVAAAVEYYLTHREDMDGYMARRDEAGAAIEAAARSRPPTDAVRRILAVKAARAAAEGS